jgi:hypothetical protein
MKGKWQKAMDKEKKASRTNDQCSVTIGMYCYDPVQTLPPLCTPAHVTHLAD